MKDPQWDQHLLRVFSVLAGLALSQSIQVVAESNFSLDAIIISLGIFFVVLDCWYQIHRDLSAIDIEGGLEVVTYMVLVLMYCCIPYLYTVRTAAAQFGFLRHELFLINMSILCAGDMVGKTLTVRRLRKEEQASSTVQRLILGKYIFYAVTDGFYALLLLLLTWVSTLLTWEPWMRAGASVLVWLVIRLVDRILIPRVSYPYAIASAPALAV